MTYETPPRDPAPLTVTTWNMLAGLATELQRGAVSLGGMAAQAWPANNLAIYQPLYLSTPFAVAAIYWINGAQNAAAIIDAGVYDESGNILFQTNCIAQGTASLPQSTAKTYTLPRGRYYAAMACSTVTTATFQRWPASQVGSHRMMGVLQQALGANPGAGVAWLPATATFAAATTTGTFLPEVGLSRIALL